MILLIAVGLRPTRRYRIGSEVRARRIIISTPDAIVVILAPWFVSIKEIAPIRTVITPIQIVRLKYHFFGIYKVYTFASCWLLDYFMMSLNGFLPINPSNDAIVTRLFVTSSCPSLFISASVLPSAIQPRRS